MATPRHLSRIRSSTPLHSTPPTSIPPTAIFYHLSRRTLTYPSRNPPPPPSSEQPSSHRPYDARKTLLHRTYVSLLRSTPLLVLFQHNNLRGGEWMAIRRELILSMRTVDDTLAKSDLPPKPISHLIRASVINGNVFQSALRVAEYLPSTLKVPATSREAFEATEKFSGKHALEPLISGPIGVLEFPTVSPVHLFAALKLMFPEKATFKKGTDPMLIAGLSKLLLLGARVDGLDGRTIDGEMTRWVSGLGGVDQLRGEVVAVLQSVGQGLVGGLESPARGLWFAMEGRKNMLEEEANPKEETLPPTSA